MAFLADTLPTTQHAPKKAMKVDTPPCDHPASSRANLGGTGGKADQRRGRGHASLCTALSRGENNLRGADVEDVFVLAHGLRAHTAGGRGR